MSFTGRGLGKDGEAVKILSFESKREGFKKRGSWERELGKLS